MHNPGKCDTRAVKINSKAGIRCCNQVPGRGEHMFSDEVISQTNAVDHDRIPDKIPNIQ